MKPFQVAATLRGIASKIEASKNPDRNLVARDLKKVVAAVSVLPFPTVTLVSEKETGTGKTYQTWKIDVTGKSITIKSMTTGGPDAPTLSGPDIMIPFENGSMSAKDIINHIITNANPEYYPTVGNSVAIDADFKK